MMRYLMIECALVLALATPGASAALTAFFVPVASGNGTVGAPYSAAVLRDEPVLRNFQTWDLRVSYTDGDWASAGLRMTLPDGFFFYKHLFGGFIKPNPLIIDAFPALHFTTYVTAPSGTGAGGAPVVLGGFPESEPVSIGDSSALLPGIFSLSWGDLVNDPPGIYTISRVTFPLGMIPSIHPLSNTSQVNPNSTAPIGNIPEPSCLLATAIVGLMLAKRR